MNCIKELRAQFGLTQDALSALTGIPRPSINHWENHAASEIGSSSLVKLARAFNCTIESILGEEEYIAPTADFSFPSTNADYELLKGFHALSDADKHRAQEYIALLSSKK